VSRTREQHREYMRAYRERAKNGGKVSRESQGGPQEGVTRPRGSESRTDSSESELEVVIDNGRLRRGQEFQEFGTACPDCYDRDAPLGERWKRDPSLWCYSDQHPTFDRRGYLIRATRRA
jgi:hypothetical protein